LIGSSTPEPVTMRVRLDELATVYADGGIDVRQLSEGTQRLRGRLEEIKGAVGASVAGSVLAGVAGGDVVARWAALDCPGVAP